MRMVLLLSAGVLLVAQVGGAALADHHGEAPVAEAAMVGAWDWGDGWTAHFKPDGYLAAAHGNVTMAILNWRLEEDRLVVRDLSPPTGAADAACAVANDGVYGVRLDAEGRMHFSAVEEACPGRARAFSNAVLTRRAVPDVDITE